MAIIRNLPIGEYHASDRVSASKAKDFRDRGARYYAQRYVSKTLSRGEASDDFVFGQAFEDMLCDRAAWTSAYAVKPDGMTFTTKDGKAWRDEARAAGKTVLSAFDVRAMEEMAEALQEHELASSLIALCETQVTLTWEHAGTPGAQARPDWLSVAGCAFTGFRPFSLDLKTTSDFGRLVSGRALLGYAYDVQAGFVHRGCTANGVRDAAHYLAVVEKQTPHRVALVEMLDTLVAHGESVAVGALDSIAACYASGSWPRCAVDVVQVGYPLASGWEE